MALPDNRFIASTSLEEYFVDKNTGLPLAGGQVYFYQDIARTNPKLVYTLTGDPNSVGGYSFVALNNPLILSATGTFLYNGNEIAVYYFPYDGDPTTSTNTLDLYYVVVQDSLGNPQFTRSAWPSIAEDIADVQNLNTYENQVSNSQFVDVLFGSSGAASYNYTAGSFIYPIAPDWDLVIIASNPGTVTVTRNAIAGNARIQTNPPYSLTVVPGLNLTTLALRQKLTNNPGIWSQTSAPQSGYVAGSILLYPNSQVTMTYVPSTGNQRQIFNETNNGANPAVFNGTTQIPPSTNSSTPPLGYSSIYLYLPLTGAGTTFSSVQVVGLSSNQASVPYLQEPVNRQLDHLFHYYNNPLQFKPVKSYLVGWDFPLNPAQFGTTGTISGSANRSNYAWDQTIIFSSAATGVSYGVNPATSGLRITARPGGATQVAVVQYLDQVAARALLNNNLSVNVSASTNNATALTATVSLWYTTAANLPNASTTGLNPNQSIVASLGTNGNVATTFGNWTQVSRSLIGSINATFAVNTATASTNYYNIPLSGWGANITGANTATYFAIVVGFSSLPANQYIDLNSISLVPGRIATIPAPQTLNDVLRDCQYYYSQSYPSASLVGTETNLGQIITPAFIAGQATANTFQVQYPAPMRTIPNLTFYPPYNAGAGIAPGGLSMYYSAPNGGATQWIVSLAPNAGPGAKTPVPITNFTTTGLLASRSTTSSVYVARTIDYGPTNTGPAFMAYQFIADARLGIV